MNLSFEVNSYIHDQHHCLCLIRSLRECGIVKVAPVRLGLL